MAKSFVKAAIELKRTLGEGKSDSIKLGDVVEHASEEDVKAVRDAVGSLVAHPISETHVTEVYAIN